MKSWRVFFFKPSGKYYTEEWVQMDETAHPWNFGDILESYLESKRLRGMTAVVLDGPWGFPHLVTIPS